VKGLRATVVLTCVVTVIVASGLTALAAPLFTSHMAGPSKGRVPSPPVPSSPADGSSVSSPTPTFTWTDDGSAAAYVVELAPAPVSVKHDGSFLRPLIRTTELVAMAYTPSVPLTIGTYAWHVQARDDPLSSAWSTTWTVTISSAFVYERLADPARTMVTDPTGTWLATFTDGASTVTLAGPAREFSEPSAPDPVVSTTWVRLLSSPFDGAVDEAWLTAELADATPDVLAVAMEYIEGAPPVYDRTGLKIAGDADFGPIGPYGTRQVGADFNDDLGVAWTYPTTVDQPEPDEINSLDCSGFVRMVFGYRGGLPLTLSPDGHGIPRRSFEILDSGPGLVTIPDTGAQVLDLDRLAPGDLVFFDASTDDGTQIDHVGIYLGQDLGGHDRFISSRKTPNGPTLGDTGAKSILDGDGFYATAFRAARRP
jgi:cell wall-associated NlpC family hydrolase